MAMKTAANFFPVNIVDSIGDAGAVFPAPSVTGASEWILEIESRLDVGLRRGEGGRVWSDDGRASCVDMVG